MSTRIFQASNRKLLINCRVTEVELDFLLAAATRIGCRSLSEFIRSAAFRAAQEIDASPKDWKTGRTTIPVCSEEERLIQKMNVNASLPTSNLSAKSDSSGPANLPVDRILLLVENALRSAAHPPGSSML